MHIRIWGARGSIPVSGKEYLKYGGDTTCLEIRSKNNDVILIDAGSGIRRCGNNLLKENIYDFSIIFTHSHWDHILGFPFFKPIYFKKTNINIYGCPFAMNSIKNMISDTMSYPHFPVYFDDINSNIIFKTDCIEDFTIGNIQVKHTLLSHPNKGMGYKFIEDDKSFVFLTDNELTYQHEGGLTFNDYKSFAENCDLLIHDAEYDEEEYKTKKAWGHSCYKDTVNLAIQANVKSYGLFHHNQDRSDEGVDNFVSESIKIISNNKSSIKCFGVYQDMELEL
jgi:ribonuclease BN (tRNA processing enzyme)